MIDHRILDPACRPFNEWLFFDQLQVHDSYVYFLQAYSLMLGADIAVWVQRHSGMHERFIYATGALNLRLPRPNPIVDFRGRPESEVVAEITNLTIRPLEVEFADVLDGGRLDLRNLELEHWRPQIDERVEVTADEFSRALALAQRVSLGTSIRGCEKRWRLIIKTSEGVIDCNSVNGTGSSDVFFDSVDELARMSGIENLPMQTCELRAMLEAKRGN